MSRLRISLLALGAAAVASTALAATATGASNSKQAVSGNLSMVGIWSGPEQKNFQLVLDGFQKKFPDVKVKYRSAGNNTPTVLSTAVAGGNPPDLAAVGQPGLVKQFSARKAIKPIDFAKGAMTKNYAASWVTLGTYSGKLYGMVFKGANKSTIWYSVQAFKNAGVTPPKTWPALLTAAKTLRASGVPAYSLGGADGWTLTDLFENIYLRAGRRGEVRPAVEPPDQVDRPVGQGRAQVDGRDLQRHRQHLRRQQGRAAGRLPDVGHERLQPPGQGRDGHRGRLRAGCRRRSPRPRRS